MKDYSVSVSLELHLSAALSDCCDVLQVAAEVMELIPEYETLQRKRLDRRIRKLIRRLEKHIKISEQDEEEEADEDLEEGSDLGFGGNGDAEPDGDE